MAQASVDQRIQDRFLYLVIVLVLYKVLSQIPIPFLGVNLLVDNLNLLSTITSAQLNPVVSIGLSGIAPYLYASSIIEFATLSIPALKKNRENGGSLWVKQINLWKRYLSLGFILLGTWQKCYSLQYGLFGLTLLDITVLMSLLVTGGLFIIWMAETISMYTVSLGSNLLIFIDILSDLGRLAFFQLTSIKLTAIIIILLILWSILILTESQRKLPLIVSRLGDNNQDLSQPTRSETTDLTDYLSVSLLPGGSTLSILTLALCLLALGVIKSSSLVVFQITLIGLTLVVYYIVAKSFVDLALNIDEIANSLRKMSVSLYGIKAGPNTIRYLNELKAILVFIPIVSTGLLILVPFLLSLYFSGIENSVFSYVPSLFLLYNIYTDLFYKFSAYINIDT